jgi:hypothetical protein
MQSLEGWDPHLASQECGAVLGLRVATASTRRGFAPQARTCASIPMPICWKAHLGIAAVPCNTARASAHASSVGCTSTATVAEMSV